jgi:hypothetical protein
MKGRRPTVYFKKIVTRIFGNIMKALRHHGREDIRLDEVDEPTCGKDQVKVRRCSPFYLESLGLTDSPSSNLNMLEFVEPE